MLVKFLREWWGFTEPTDIGHEQIAVSEAWEREKNRPPPPDFDDLQMGELPVRKTRQ